MDLRIFVMSGTDGAPIVLELIPSTNLKPKTALRSFHGSYGPKQER